jgi:hypothetical protein
MEVRFSRKDQPSFTLKIITDREYVVFTEAELTHSTKAQIQVNEIDQISAHDRGLNLWPSLDTQRA